MPRYESKSAAASVYWTRSGTALSPSTAGDTVDMANAIIENIGAAGTDFTATGGLNIVDKVAFGPNGDVYCEADNAVNFSRTTDAAATGWINYYGYAGGATQFRNLSIGDGKGVACLTITGSSKLTSLFGPLVLGPTSTPASNASGSPGQVAWDADYLYICTATNTWERIALTGGY